jgi:enoyl-CoA hydratase/3-hydroxyacyl-CoA dehydrogenase
MKINEIDTVCYVGAGTMGCFNALMAAGGGYRAVMYDVSSEALNSVPDVLTGMAGRMAGQGFFSADAVPDILTRISVESDLISAVAEADLVSESVSERLEIKRSVHRELDTLCRADTIITTNTSSLLVSQIQDVFKNGRRFAALHSHLGSVLIDVVGGVRTSPTCVDTLKRYVESINAMPLVLKKESHGYVLNAMLGPFLTVSQILVAEGIATIQNIDRAWMQYAQAPIGPFGLMDFFGLNIIHDSWQEPKPGREHLKEKVLAFIAPYIESNTLGVKSGKGFYSYPEPEYQDENFLLNETDLTGLQGVLGGILIAHAILITQKGVAKPSAIDRAWMVSMSLSKGPFGALDEMGIDGFLEAHAKLVGQGLFPAELAVKVEAFLQPFIDKGHLGEKAGQGFYRYPEPAYQSPEFGFTRK